MKEQMRKISPSPPAATGGFEKYHALPRSHLVQEFAGRNLPVGIPAKEMKRYMEEFAAQLYPKDPEKAYKVLLFSPPMLAPTAEIFKSLLVRVYPKVPSLNSIFPSYVAAVLDKEQEKVSYVMKQFLLSTKAMVNSTGDGRKEEAIRVMTYLNMLSVSFENTTYDKVNPPQLADKLINFLKLRTTKGDLARIITFAVEESLAILGKQLFLQPPLSHSLASLEQVKEIKETITKLQA